jgi:hypothetical protein
MRALIAEGVMKAFKSLPPGKQNFIVRRMGTSFRLVNRRINGLPLMR